MTELKYRGKKKNESKDMRNAWDKWSNIHVIRVPRRKEDKIELKQYLKS